MFAGHESIKLRDMSIVSGLSRTTLTVTQSRVASWRIRPQASCSGDDRLDLVLLPLQYRDPLLPLPQRVALRGGSLPTTQKSVMAARVISARFMFPLAKGQHGIQPTESERIGQGAADVRPPRLVRDRIEVTGRIGLTKVRRRRDHAVL